MIKTFIEQIKTNKQLLIFTFVLSYLIVINLRIERNNLSYHILLPDAPIATFFGALLIFYLVKKTRDLEHTQEKSKQNSFNYYAKIFTVALLLYMIITNIFSLFISISYGYYIDDFNAHIAKKF